eukprot:5236543-Ditylum_brightwellii.AAC.1
MERVDTVAQHCGNESDDINDKDTDYHTVFIGVDTDENNEDAMKGTLHVNNTLTSNCNWDGDGRAINSSFPFSCSDAEAIKD